jgi:hypothetical protein
MSLFDNNSDDDFSFTKHSKEKKSSFLFEDLNKPTKNVKLFGKVPNLFDNEDILVNDNFASLQKKVVKSIQAVDYKVLYEEELEKRLKLELDLEEVTMHVAKLEYDLRKYQQTVNDSRQIERMKKQNIKRQSSALAINRSNKNEEIIKPLESDSSKTNSYNSQIDNITTTSSLIEKQSNQSVFNQQLDNINDRKKFPSLFDDDDDDDDNNKTNTNGYANHVLNLDNVKERGEEGDNEDAFTAEFESTKASTSSVSSVSAAVDERLLKQKARIRQQKVRGNVRSLRVSSSKSNRNTSGVANISDSVESETNKVDVVIRNSEVSSSQKITIPRSELSSNNLSQWDSDGDEEISPKAEEGVQNQKNGNNHNSNQNAIHVSVAHKTSTLTSFDESSDDDNASSERSNSGGEGAEEVRHRQEIRPHATEDRSHSMRPSLHTNTKTIAPYEQLMDANLTTSDIERVVIQWARGKDLVHMIASLPEIYRGSDLPKIDFSNIYNSTNSDIRKYYLYVNRKVFIILSLYMHISVTSYCYFSNFVCDVLLL